MIVLRLAHETECFSWRVNVPVGQLSLEGVPAPAWPLDPFNSLVGSQEDL
jgi:hypothetical protein